jgi:hypothetical protein
MRSTAGMMLGTGGSRNDKALGLDRARPERKTAGSGRPRAGQEDRGEGSLGEPYLASGGRVWASLASRGSLWHDAPRGRREGGTSEDGGEGSV